MKLKLAGLVMTLLLFGAGIILLSAIPAEAYNRTSPIVNATLVPINTSLYNQTFNDTLGRGDFTNMSAERTIYDVLLPLVIAYGPFFWLMLFGAFALAMFIFQEDGRIPAALTIIAGIPLVVWQLPYIWQKGITTAVILIIAGILYAARKKRF